MSHFDLGSGDLRGGQSNDLYRRQMQTAEQMERSSNELARMAHKRRQGHDDRNIKAAYLAVLKEHVDTYREALSCRSSGLKEILRFLAQNLHNLLIFLTGRDCSLDDEFLILFSSLWKQLVAVYNDSCKNRADFPEEEFWSSLSSWMDRVRKYTRGGCRSLADYLDSYNPEEGTPVPLINLVHALHVNWRYMPLYNALQEWIASLHSLVMILDGEKKEKRPARIRCRYTSPHGDHDKWFDQVLELILK